MSDENLIEISTRNSKLAAAAAIIGLISFAFGPAIVPAVVPGHIALIRINRSKGALCRKGLCILALVMGYLGAAFLIYDHSQR